MQLLQRKRHILPTRLIGSIQQYKYTGLRVRKDLKRQFIERKHKMNITHHFS